MDELLGVAQKLEEKMLSMEFLSWLMDLDDCMRLVPGMAGSCRQEKGHSLALCCPWRCSWLYFDNLVMDSAFSPVRCLQDWTSVIPIGAGKHLPDTAQEGICCKRQQLQLSLTVLILGKMWVCFSTPKLPVSKTSLCLPIWSFPT